MKTITYNPETHRLVPVEPNNTALDWVDPGFGTRKEAWERILASFPQPEPVEVEPVLYAEFSEDGGWLGEASEYQDHLEEPIALYTAPPDYEAVKKQRDELAAVFQLVIAEMEHRDRGDGNAPGHGHDIPGVWDSDNGKLSGKPCAWCAVWKKAKELCAALTSVKGGV